MKAYRRGLHPRAVARARFQVLRHRDETGPAVVPEYVTELERMASWYARSLDGMKNAFGRMPWV